MTTAFSAANNDYVTQLGAYTVVSPINALAEFKKKGRRYRFLGVKHGSSGRPKMRRLAPVSLTRRRTRMTTCVRQSKSAGDSEKN